MEYIIQRIKKMKVKNSKKLKHLLCYYVFIQILLMIFVIDSMLFNVQNNQKQTIIGTVNIVEIIPQTISGTYPKTIFEINGELYVLYWRSNLRKLPYNDYYKVSESIANEAFLEVIVEEQYELLPSKYGHLKSIIDIRNDKNVYVDIENTISDKKREITATVIIFVFLFFSITFLFFLRLFLLI